MMKPEKGSSCDANIAGSSGELSCPVKSFRFFVRTLIYDETEDVSSYIIEIPSNCFNLFKDVDPFVYTSHYHGADETTGRFCHFPMHPQKIDFTPGNEVIACSPVVLDSIVYVLIAKRETPSLSFRSINLNTRVTTHLPSPLADRWSPKAFTLCGKVYLLGGLIESPEVTPQYFGEFFDPVTNLWSFLNLPSDVDFTTGDHLFIASLGDGAAKFMVYNPLLLSIIHFYNVGTEMWETFPSLVFDCLNVPHNIVGVEIINTEDENLYWLQSDGYICSLDLKYMQLYKGSIVGLEYVDLFRRLNAPLCGVSFHHLWADNFCVLWSDTYFRRPMPTKTEYHFTFLKMVKDPLSYKLTFFVVGCFEDSFDHSYIFNEAIRA